MSSPVEHRTGLSPAEIRETANQLRYLRREHLDGEHKDSGHSISASLNADKKCDEIRALDNSLRALAQLDALSAPPGSAEGPTKDADFYQSFDARVWATAWLAIIAKNPSIPTSEGAMISWFANALMRGWDEHARRYPDPLPTPRRSEEASYEDDSLRVAIDAARSSAAPEESHDG